MPLTFLLILLALDAAPATPVEVLKDVPYVQNGGPDQVLDFYWPATKPAAAVLFIHGGSLQESGERRSSPPYADVCKPFVAAGIACATADYRLAPRHSWPAMPDDVAAALLKVRQLVTARGGVPRVFLFGHSSGCHLAAIVATNPKHLARVGLSPSDIAGIIPMGCTLDREDTTLRGLTAERIRAAFARDAQEVATFGTAENWLAANPASFAGKHVPPTLVVVAREERFMPPVLEQGARFVRMLLEVGVPANLVIVPGKHMSSIESIGSPNDPTFSAIRKFIENPTAAGTQ
jgi:acetyl esterase/lipase